MVTTVTANEKDVDPCKYIDRIYVLLVIIMISAMNDKSNSKQIYQNFAKRKW